MSNHIHVAMIAGAAPLESWAKRVHSPFATWMNRQRGRLGPLIADRPKDIAVPDDRVPHLIAYIHNNPVRAGIVERAVGSVWTSHLAYTGRATCAVVARRRGGAAALRPDARRLRRVDRRDPGRGAMAQRRGPAARGAQARRARARDAGRWHPSTLPAGRAAVRARAAGPARRRRGRGPCGRLAARRGCARVSAPRRPSTDA